jgi:Bacterial regulatory protein, Fis family
LSGIDSTTDYLAGPDNTAQSLAPNEIIRLLIGLTVGEVERALVVQTLASCGGNRTHAARVLGLSVRTLRNKIRVYAAQGIEVPAAPGINNDRSWIPNRNFSFSGAAGESMLTGSARRANHSASAR